MPLNLGQDEQIKSLRDMYPHAVPSGVLSNLRQGPPSEITPGASPDPREKLKTILKGLLSAGLIGGSVAVPFLAPLAALVTGGFLHQGARKEELSDAERAHQMKLEEIRTAGEVANTPAKQKAAAAEQIGGLASGVASVPTLRQKIQVLRGAAAGPASPGLAEYAATQLTELPKQYKDMRSQYLQEGLAAGKTGQELANYVQDREAEAEGKKAAARAPYSWAAMRQVPVIDTQMGNAPRFVSQAELERASKEEPGRYSPVGATTNALTQTALIEDIRGAIGQVKNALAGLDVDFSPAMKTRIAFAMRDPQPGSAISALINSEAGRELTPQQQDYLISAMQLREQAMAMRAVLKAGQGSDMMRQAILMTLPSATTPTKEYATKQLQLFENTLDRLARGIPSVSLKGQAPPETTTPGSSSGRRPLSSFEGR